MTVARQQQALFPDLPRDKKIADKDGNLMPAWDLYFQQMNMALQSNFTPEGFVIPPQTAANIALLIGTASFNNIVYDSTNNEFKGNVNGTWKTFTLV